MKKPVILAIESSCDETAAAVMIGGELLSNVIASQVVHSAYGGVVPELASRQHQKNIVPVVEVALDRAGIKKQALEVIAVTKGPGLLGSLLVGNSFAQGLAQARRLPLVEVDHLKAHLLANFIEPPCPTFPFLGLVVSGGHTQLIKAHGPEAMEVMGSTRDDAVGEAFDKAAKMMGLPYPGGHHIDRYAQQGAPQAFKLPIADLEGLDFSFSGVKAAFRRLLEEQTAREPFFVEKHRADLCASLQHCLVEMVVRKVVQAVRLTGLKQVVLGGGVANNSGIRAALQSLGRQGGWSVYFPKPVYCTDNAAMVAMAAHLSLQPT